VRVRGLKHTVARRVVVLDGVAPRAGAWIETASWLNGWLGQAVAPRAGAWIETAEHGGYALGHVSHPVRVRGLKQEYRNWGAEGVRVAPRAGAWIETAELLSDRAESCVAPSAGAWIETRMWPAGSS